MSMDHEFRGDDVGTLHHQKDRVAIQPTILVYQLLNDRGYVC
jgi:hypothetical protein